MLAAAAAQADESVDFQRQIQPMFAEHCFQCHGPDERARKGKLRLDVREGAVSGGDAPDSRSIVPGHPEQSELLRRVTSADPDLVMPPPEQNNPLKPEQVAILKRWIQEGARYSEHWAFTAPRRPAVPEVAPSGADAPGNTLRNPIDLFVAARLASDALELSPTAPHDVLCRRIYLDVIGLPPSPAEVDVFVAAAGKDLPAAVSDLVDRLLESAHFGEKWARHWLDVARYADSNGYEKDVQREQWAWRDWVIQALNADMPYDQFLVEQFAGDLLPDRTQEQLVATGFLRNGMINEEGAIVFERFRMEGMFDRIDCVGKAVLGLSIQCAQCHSHKFDPISQEEYYGLFAFLNDTYEAQSWVYSPEQEQKIAEIEAGTREIERRAKTLRPNWREELHTWENEQRDSTPVWETLDTTEQVWIGGLNHPVELPDHSVVMLGHPTTSGEFYVVAEPSLEAVTGLQLEALTYGDLPFGGPGRNEQGVFAVTELRVEIMDAGSKAWTKLPLAEATADFSEAEKPLIATKNENDKEKKDERRVGPVAFLIDEDEKTAWRADRGPGRRNTDSVAVVRFAKPAKLPSGTQLKVTLVYRHSLPGGVRQCTQLGRMRLALTSSPEPRASRYDHAAALAMQKPVANRSASEHALVFSAWREALPELNVLNAEIAAVEKQHPEAPTSVLCVLPRRPEHRRETALLERGAWDRPKHSVTPHTPAILHPAPGEPSDRLAFARWLADRRSPLTARVQVNRVWQAMFGTGLVETPEDFGTRTSQPEYVKVLDWLAVEFMDQGWSLKRLVRAIVSSATYQQTSRVTPELLEIDPRNRLLARGPRFRAEAEVVRDIALSVSGLLHRKIGGPSIFPPVPQNVLSDNFGGRLAYWVTAEGPERYRRALYVFRKRSMPDPTLNSFDAPNADLACARRVRSNTPLSALVALNEPIFTEAGRALALRILREGGSTDAERADYAFRVCTGRRSRAAERAEVLALLDDRRTRLAEGWLSINEVATGDPTQGPAIPPDTTPQDAAAWTIAARVLLNLDETLSKN